MLESVVKYSLLYLPIIVSHEENRCIMIHACTLHIEKRKIMEILVWKFNAMKVILTCENTKMYKIIYATICES